MTYETRAVLAGAYVSRATAFLTHVVAIAEGFEDRPLCGRVKAESICDGGATDTDVPATCSTCRRLDPRRLS